MEIDYLRGYATDRTILQLRELFEEAKRVAGVTPSNDPPSTRSIFQMVKLAYR